jgi:hypothetical protein
MLLRFFSCRIEIFQLATPEYAVLLLLTKGAYSLPLYTYQQLQICHQTNRAAFVFLNNIVRLISKMQDIFCGLRCTLRDISWG